MELFRTKSGKIQRISTQSLSIPFRKEQGIYVIEDDNTVYIELSMVENGLHGEYQGIIYNVKYDIIGKDFIISIEMENSTGERYSPQAVGFNPGIDCFMERYPEWNNQFFPTFMRCEKTHFWGYMMSPLGNKIAICVDSPVASYHLDYNIMWGFAYGHKIYACCIDLMHCAPMPDRHPKNCRWLEAGEKKVYKISLTPLLPEESLEECFKEHGIPVISAEKYTMELGERPSIRIGSKSKFDTEWIYPDTSRHKEMGIMEQYGRYTLIVKNEDGFISQAEFYCRKSWSTYLKMARKEAINKPQKATTHCESWYGFFSAFLAQKHYPEKNEDKICNDLFDEILPILYDIEKAEPIIIPWRIQNTAAMISLLSDKYLIDPSKNEKYLVLANGLADWLLGAQSEGGAFLSKGKDHYTCVIYIAKSILELAEIELNSEEYKENGKKLFKAAGKAIDDLVEHLEDIGTEGEHTLEDGMISCSALQIGMYALMLPKEQREKYIRAAEHMITVHMCLEQKFVPDCRFNNCSLRFWESQYDVMILHNFVNSPHGWTAWTIYAKYYLYLLTGKIQYLKEAANAMGACVQLMTLDGNLRWAFAVDPYIKAKMFVPNTKKTVQDGYAAVELAAPAYRAVFKTMEIGEQYIDMISGWFRMGSRRVAGGFFNCPVIYDEREEKGDIQGGSCDNDVHEIFKCMEEIFLKKIFIAKDNENTYVVGGVLRDGKVYASDDVDMVHINNIDQITVVKLNGDTVRIENKSGFVNV